MMKPVGITSLLLLLAGCIAVPHVAYNDQGHPLDQTAILIAHVDTDKASPCGELGLVDKVDGLMAKARWVRVKPGSQTFIITYSVDYECDPDRSLWEIKLLRGQAPLKIADMKAQHTYRVRYSRDASRFHVTYEDLGKGATEGMRVCGADKRCKDFKPSFK